LERTAVGVVPEGEGWFLLNARDVSWIRSEEARAGHYHGERGQEDFLVVSGECVLVIAGEERRLRLGTSCTARTRSRPDMTRA
jgi:hypothetical protein